MGKTRWGKDEHGTYREVPMTPELRAVVVRQRERFREKFGRDPGPHDPVFFDPDADEPKEMQPSPKTQELLDAVDRLPGQIAWHEELKEERAGIVKRNLQESMRFGGGEPWEKQYGYAPVAGYRKLVDELIAIAMRPRLKVRGGAV